MPREPSTSRGAMAIGGSTAEVTNSRPVAAAPAITSRQTLGSATQAASKEASVVRGTRISVVSNGNPDVRKV